ncbi:COG3179 Predicted chitinase [uncultured Caudovirales phage]|uniref:COG3179 Predicted chitinase n=1 Tax=uncultured Caudovirales phage TaxID=2100421 RepID=A0A6J7WW14_9CAUD|nr:COG3179 Predicted chitinase [uncultured Caudovirales phage]
MVNAEQLRKLGIGVEWVDPLNETFQRFNISTPRQQAAFIGQCGHECGNFRILEENLNYRAATLMRLWAKRFPTLEVANAYAGNPKKIANMVYASRMGNRDEKSGDGYRFRGRGCIQLTGYSNYFHASQALGVDFVMNPDLVSTPQYAALTAGWFWDTHKCNAKASTADWTGLTKIINGGVIGLDDRVKHTQMALAAFDASSNLA